MTYVEMDMDLSDQERSNIYTWLESHTEYQRSVEDGKFFWERFSNRQLYAFYNKTKEEGYSLIPMFKRNKRGERVSCDSYAKRILDFQRRTGMDFYSESDLMNITIERLRELCIEYQLITPGRKRVAKYEPAPQTTVIAARNATGAIIGNDLLEADMSYDQEEQFLTTDEIIQMYGVDATDLSPADFAPRGIRVLDAENGEFPYNAKREELKEKLINFIIMNKVQDHRGNKFTRKQLVKLDISDLVIIYESFRSKLDSETLKNYPPSDQLETDVRFGR